MLKKKCCVPNCENKYRCKGYCETHYNRIRKWGDPYKIKQVYTRGKLCSYLACSERSRYSGYCYKHYRYVIGKQKELIRRKLKKITVFNAYGGCICNCCGETNVTFLTIDHINNDGSQHRKNDLKVHSRTYQWLIDNNFPKGFQVLCFNCNIGKHINKGICPHKDV